MAPDGSRSILDYLKGGALDYACETIVGSGAVLDIASLAKKSYQQYKKTGVKGLASKGMMAEIASTVGSIITDELSNGIIGLDDIKEAIKQKSLAHFLNNINLKNIAATAALGMMAGPLGFVAARAIRSSMPDVTVGDISKALKTGYSERNASAGFNKLKDLIKERQGGGGVINSTDATREANLSSQLQKAKIQARADNNAKSTMNEGRTPGDGERRSGGQADERQNREGRQGSDAENVGNQNRENQEEAGPAGKEESRGEDQDGDQGEEEKKDGEKDKNKDKEENEDKEKDSENKKENESGKQDKSDASSENEKTPPISKLPATGPGSGQQGNKEEDQDSEGARQAQLTRAQKGKKAEDKKKKKEEEKAQAKAKAAKDLAKNKALSKVLWGIIVDASCLEPIGFGLIILNILGKYIGVLDKFVLKPNFVQEWCIRLIIIEWTIVFILLIGGISIIFLPYRMIHNLSFSNLVQLYEFLPGLDVLWSLF